MVLLDGVSLIPRIGIHTQKIPPIISVKDKSVNSAAGNTFDPIEYKINPRHTNVPCNANKLSFLLEDKKLKSFWIIIIVENIQQNKPATATVVNFGVSGFHLNEIEKIENPKAEAKPNINPVIDPKETLPNDIIMIPMEAIVIAIQTLVDIFSLKNKKPSRAVIKGIADKHNKVIAAEVLVIDHMNVIIAVPRPHPPINPAAPIFK